MLYQYQVPTPVTKSRNIRLSSRRIHSFAAKSRNIRKSGRRIHSFAAKLRNIRYPNPIFYIRMVLQKYKISQNISQDIGTGSNYSSTVSYLIIRVLRFTNLETSCDLQLSHQYKDHMVEASAGPENFRRTQCHSVIVYIASSGQCRQSSHATCLRLLVESAGPENFRRTQ